MWQTLQRVRGLHWAVIFLAGIATVMLGIAVTIYLIVVFQEQLTPRPLIVQEVQSNVGGSLCPGDPVRTILHFALQEPVLIDVFGVITDTARQRVYVGARRDHFTLPAQQVGEYHQPLDWHVPLLQPGDYTYAITLWFRGVGADPVFVGVPFTVRPGCHG